MFRALVLACLCSGLPLHAESLMAVCGYSNSFLYHTIHPEAETLPLGETPNAFSPVFGEGEQILVVHSGDYVSGEGCQLLPLSFSEQGVEADSPLTMPDFSNPWHALVVGDEYYVSLTVTGELARVSPVGTITTISSGLSAPEGLCYRASDNCLFACESGWGSGDQLFWYDLDNGNSGSITVGVNPQQVILAESGELYVLCSGASWSTPPVAASLWKIVDFETQASLALASNPAEMLLLMDGRLAVADGYAYGTPALQIVDLESFELLADPPLTSASQLAQGGSGLWVGDTSGHLVCYDDAWNVLQSMNTGGAVIDLVCVETSSALGPQYYPQGFQLAAAYPNPFNPRTWLSYELQQAADLSLQVYNLRGERVRQLRVGFTAAGQHRVAFEAGNLASGTYLVELRVGSESQVQRVTLLR